MRRTIFPKTIAANPFAAPAKQPYISVLERAAPRKKSFVAASKSHSFELVATVETRTAAT